MNNEDVVLVALAQCATVDTSNLGSLCNSTLLNLDSTVVVAVAVREDNRVTNNTTHIYGAGDVSTILDNNLTVVDVLVALAVGLNCSTLSVTCYTTQTDSAAVTQDCYLAIVGVVAHHSALVVSR